LRTLAGAIIAKGIRELKPDYSGTMAYADEVCHECPHCDSTLWNVKASFQDYEMSQYMLDMECSVCGSYAKAPTPLDRPNLI
jgi:hypothetical protein